MSKVLFANPAYWGKRIGSLYEGGVRAGSRWPFMNLTKSFPGRKFNAEYCPYPFFMGFAATYAAKAGADVTFRDSLALRESYGRLYEMVKSFEYIVIESATPSWDHDAWVIKTIKEHNPHIKVIVTGTIGATRAEEILHNHPVHAVCRGEYEKGVVRVLNGESGVIDFDFLTEQEMNEQPPPYMDREHAGMYYDNNPKGNQYPLLHAWASRGCFAVCLFCSWPATMTGNDPEGKGGRKVRNYNSDWILSWMPKWIKDYGFRSVYFDDDIFNGSNKHVRDICRAMRIIGIPWSAMCRADSISWDVWKEMKDSGCFGVKLGFESGSDRVVNQIIGKNLNLDKARETTHYLKSLGMTVHGTFAFNHPGETPEEMQMTVEYRKSLNLDSYQESGMALLEGTPAQSLIQLGKLDRYPDAKVDENFISDADGARKMHALEQAGLCH